MPEPPARPSSAPVGKPFPHVAGDLLAGKYRLENALGQGGMGAVWSARNELLETDVAIKFLRGEDQALHTERFLQEARAAAQLGHSNIVRVFDFGTAPNGDPFLVMELLSGMSLADVLDRDRRVPATDAVSLLLPVCSALEAVHQRNIVHRDLKPDNIILVRDEEGHRVPKLVDFGIVKILPASDRTSRPTTSAGSLLGTPDYMAPEQARGAVDVDARADIWGLSVVLYELVTGKRPFEAENYLALFRVIIESKPVPITALAAGDDELWAVIEKGLQKDPANRWPSMREFGRALATWAITHRVETDCSGASIVARWFPDKPTTLNRKESALPAAVIINQPSSMTSTLTDSAPRSWKETPPPVASRSAPTRMIIREAPRVPPIAYAAAAIVAALVIGVVVFAALHSDGHGAVVTTNASASATPPAVSSVAAPAIASVADPTEVVDLDAPGTNGAAGSSKGKGLHGRAPGAKAPPPHDMPLPKTPTF